MNETIKEYLALKEDVRRMSKRIDEINLELKRRGTFLTDQYMCVITRHVQERIKPLHEVIAVYGREALEQHKLINVLNYPVVHVGPRNVDELPINIPIFGL